MTPTEEDPLLMDPLLGPNISVEQDTLENGTPRLKQSKYKREVEYDGDNHLAVLFQQYGSVWPEVFPWCLVTLAVTYVIILLRNHNIIDLTIQSNNGHNFMSILVSFLVVTRATITYNRFMEARQHLSDIYLSAREVVNHACVLSSSNQNEEAKAWRREVAYRTIVTLRMAIAAAEYRSHGINAWEDLPDEDHERTNLILPPQSPGTRNVHELMQLTHGPRTLADENMRAPIDWAFNLRETIMSTRSGTVLPNRPFHVNEELKILAFCHDFVAAFHGVKKLITTPFPFPLVQMTRTFLFFWVFTLPLVLINDNDQTWEILILMFFITYGFLGLEYVNIELDDPYSDDPNDFPGRKWAETVYLDIYLTIFKTDGYESASKLRQRVTERFASGPPLENYRKESRRRYFWFRRRQNQRNQ